MNFLRLALCGLLCLCQFVSLNAEESTGQRIAIIKADDVRGKHSKWDRFIRLSKDLGVKVSLGLIGNSLQKQDPEYHQWLKDWIQSGHVEFWHHGWDHQKWEANGKQISEFGGSGYDHQKGHLLKTQKAIKSTTGEPFLTFGSPFNALDDDTAVALNELPELRLVFAYPNNKVLPKLKDKIILPMTLRGEHDGIGKPNFAKFEEDYLKKENGGYLPTFAAIQFHPMGFSEEGFKHYTDILDFLLSKGWTFILPKEYANSQKQK